MQYNDILAETMKLCLLFWLEASTSLIGRFADPETLSSFTQSIGFQPKQDYCAAEHTIYFF